MVQCGKLGGLVSLEQGRTAAAIAVENCLASIVGEVASLREVSHVVEMTVYVASAPGFNDQAAVADGASERLADLLDDTSGHVRSAVGVAELPGDAPVEISMILSLRSAAAS